MHHVAIMHTAKRPEPAAVRLFCEAFIDFSGLSRDDIRVAARQQECGARGGRVLDGRRRGSAGGKGCYRQGERCDIDRQFAHGTHNPIFRAT